MNITFNTYRECVEICNQLSLERVQLDTIKLYNEMNSFINENIVELDYDSALYTEDTDNKDKRWYEKIWDWIRGVFEKIGNFFKKLFSKEKSKEEQKEEAEATSELYKDLSEESTEIDASQVSDEEFEQAVNEQVQQGEISQEEAQQLKVEKKEKSKHVIKKFFLKILYKMKNYNPLIGAWEKNPANFILILYIKKYISNMIFELIDSRLDIYGDFQITKTKDSDGKIIYQRPNSYQKKNETDQFCQLFSNENEFTAMKNAINSINNDKFQLKNLFNIKDLKQIESIYKELVDIKNELISKIPNFQNIKIEIYGDLKFDDKKILSIEEKLEIACHEFALISDYSSGELQINALKAKDNISKFAKSFAELQLMIANDVSFITKKKTELKNSKILQVMLKSLPELDSVKRFGRHISFINNKINN